ncbi:hypothetical protein N7481_009671 [Penicillium waksmanii]|uniref:uncharacterized protein n=1 Tax=Penicillium waksmanii TaxID=69791 RepID=UPI002548FFB8|nr:uncharacterized protein N7481_009671 [Penicillium waksmanii]KAJ5975964.1 hypothetical protein N7481_009671 [Penicillium waksmanii]
MALDDNRTLTPGVLITNDGHFLNGYSDLVQEHSTRTIVMRRYNKSLFNVENSTVFINVPEGVQTQDSNSSSLNEANVQATMALVDKLLNQFQVNKKFKRIFNAGDISILTFYSAQEELHRIAMAELDHKGRYAFMDTLFQSWLSLNLLLRPSFIRKHLETWAQEREDHTSEANAGGELPNALAEEDQTKAQREEHTASNLKNEPDDW